MYWVSTEGPVILIGACLPTMIPLGRQIKANYLSPMASSIFRAQLRYRTSGDRLRNHTGDFPTGTPSVYQGANFAQGQDSATKLYPSGRDLENLYKFPNPADTCGSSPWLTQPQHHYAAGVRSYDTPSASLAMPERCIRVDSNFSQSSTLLKTAPMISRRAVARKAKIHCTSHI